MNSKFLFRQNTSRALGKITEELGNLVGNNFNEVMEQITIHVRTEMEKAIDVANKVEKDYTDFKKNVDHKIMDQKFAFKKLKENVNALNVKIEEFKTALEKWQIEETIAAAVRATISVLRNIATILTGKAPLTSKVVYALEKIAALMELIYDIYEMIKTIMSTFDVNTKYDKDALEDLQFEATIDFTESLKQASYFKQKAYQFDELTSSANAYIDQIVSKTKLNEATDLKNAMTLAGEAGNRLVNEVTYTRNVTL